MREAKVASMKLSVQHAIAAIFLVLSFAAPVAADGSTQWKDVDNKALGALMVGDYATALKLIRPLADRGVAEAQVHLGAMYMEGLGVPRNYAEAVKWFQLSADQGLADGQRWLGEMYFSGKGVPQNYAEALKWFQLSAEQGDPWAQSRLGDMYSNTQGVPQDYVRAYMWYLLAFATNEFVGRGLLRIEPHMTPSNSPRPRSSHVSGSELGSRLGSFLSHVRFGS